ncbi:MAG: DUF202 domain-containing protein [Pirellulales bacterium]
MVDTTPPYAQDTLLRDRLAVDRTVLANERTLLSYVRTALALVIMGVTALHFWDAPLVRLAGVLTILLAGLILVVGMGRYRRMQRRVASAGASLVQEHGG